MAVVGMANRIETIEYVVSTAVGSAGTALVGQNLGARRPDRAVEVVRTALRWNLWFDAAVTLVILLVPSFFISLFTQDPEAHRLGVPYLRVLAGCLIFNGMELVVAESILGSGHTRIISVIFTLTSLVRIPLAFVVPAWGGIGVIGIAWVITLTCVVRCALILAWAARGTWKEGLGNELHGAAPIVPGPDGGGY
jgi:Na+-driven multidrug efflux pump